MHKSYLTRAQTRVASFDFPIGDPTGGPAYGERRDPISAIVSVVGMVGAAEAAGGVLAALSFESIAAGLAFAGSALSLVGNITGNSDLMKIGGIAGLAGGVGMMANAFESTAAGSVAGSANAAEGPAASAMTSGGGATAGNTIADALGNTQELVGANAASAATVDPSALATANANAASMTASPVNAEQLSNWSTNGLTGAADSVATGATPTVGAGITSANAPMEVAYTPNATAGATIDANLARSGLPINQQSVFEGVAPGDGVTTLGPQGAAAAGWEPVAQKGLLGRAWDAINNPANKNAINVLGGVARGLGDALNPKTSAEAELAKSRADYDRWLMGEPARVSASARNLVVPQFINPKAGPVTRK